MGLFEVEMDVCLNDEVINQVIIDSYDCVFEVGIIGMLCFVFNGQMLDSECDGNCLIFILGGNLVLIDGELVEVIVDVDNFCCLFDYLVE